MFVSKVSFKLDTKINKSLFSVFYKLKIYSTEMEPVVLRNTSNPATQFLPRLSSGKLSGGLKDDWKSLDYDLQVYKPRWEELCEKVPAGDIQENSANPRELFFQVKLSLFVLVHKPY